MEKQERSVISLSPEASPEREGLGSDSCAHGDTGTVTSAQLKTRVDQQSTLISMLKQRNDATFKELEQCKQLCQTGTAHNQELQKQLSEALRAKSVLEQRFHTLSSNYEELTRIMDEYKRENRKIRTELEKKSKESVLVEIEEKNGQLLALRETTTERDERVRLLEGRCSILEDEIRELTKTEKENKAVFSRQLHREQQNQRVVEQTLAQTEAKLEKMEREMALLRLSNGCLQKSLREGETFAKENSLENEQLQFEIEKLKSEKATLHQDLQRVSVELSRDVQVSKLQQRLKDEEKKREKLQREFQVYQKHSSEMLRKEQELNTKLRHLSDI